MPAKYPIAPIPAEEQVSRALSLLALYGATPGKSLWHAIDEAVMKRNAKIERLEFENKILKERKP